jgi:heme oxygenase (mycobilin-producing)
MNIPVVAINVYAVPQEKEEEFLIWWFELKETIIGNPGFIKGRLHRSLHPDVRFNFINVVEWENSNYSQAYEHKVQWMQAKLTELGVEMTPALFAIASEY